MDLLLTFILGVVTSFIVSIPIGPVNMAVFQTTLNKSRIQGYAIGFGAILAEAFYCGIPLFGVGSFNQDHVIFDILYIIFVPVLFFLGIHAIYHRKKDIGLEDEDAKGSGKKITKKANRTLFGQVVYGFLLCGSNPMTFVFWVQATILIRKNNWLDDQFSTLLAFYIGVPVGTFILYACFAQLAHFTRKRINPKLRERLNILIGGIFIFISLYLLLTFLELKGIIHLGIAST